ncbi:MAG: protein-disulfide reductase DsbD [Gammaproteobacteria bacterium]|nr:protein-disulfide reductase DsbD [Gammaproteobacteria bacterium]MDH3506222.1 protein-disulfide reductase DsbD [Gammaproteobacteria bacterium]
MRNLLIHLRTLGIAALIAASVVACDQQAVAQQEEILRPEQAFPYTLEATADEVLVRFDVPEGYYLYRERFDFDTDTTGIALGEPAYPDGEVHEDEFFGVVETYRHRLDIPIPFQRTTDASELNLLLTVQGCADIGLCYPPQDWNRTVALPAAAAPSGTSALTTLLTGNAASNDEQLPAEQAFVMNARVDGANELVVGWTIEPGYYMYADKFDFAVDGPIGLGAAELPEGIAHDDYEFGNVMVFFGYVEARIPFSRATPDAVQVELTSSAQGCKLDSLCYPPMERVQALTIPATSEFDMPVALEPMVSEQDRLADLIVNGSWWLVLGTFYGFGLLLAFTPCVLPMVPILSGMIAGQGRETTAMRGFTLSLAYVMGMALTYTAGGAIAAVAGAQVQATFQQPWILTVFAGMFVLLALAMFGAFEMQMPAAIQTRLSALAGRQSAGSYLGVAVMGVLSALIVTTCVAPPLIATLAVIGQTGDVPRGAGALFALSMGMGSPLLVVGASAGKLLPKAGPWMNMVKGAFGVMMIAVAIWMMDRVLPGSVVLVLWALLVFLSGVFLGAFEPLPEGPSGSQRLRKGVGVLACLYGALMLIGASLGGTNPLRPVQLGAFGGAVGQQATPVTGLEFIDIETVAELEAAVAQATAAGRPVMVDLTAEWCISCKEMEHYTFPDPSVVAAYDPFTLLRVDVTENDDDDKAMLRYFETYGPPIYAFFDRNGQIRDEYELVGFFDAEDFSAHARRFAAL